MEVVLDPIQDKPIRIEAWILSDSDDLTFEEALEDLGGPGSGHHGHKGTKGSQGGSATGHRVSGTYKSDVEARRVSKNYAGGGLYNEVDGAVKEPVRILNEELGYRTYASCEGHPEDHRKEVGAPIGYIYDDEGHVIGSRFQESYIALKSVRDADHFERYLLENGFKEGSTKRIYAGGAEGWGIYRNLSNNSCLTANFNKDTPTSRTRVSLRISGGRVDMGKAKWTEWPETGQRFRNTLRVGKVVDQKSWDGIRDGGWETWLNLLGGM